MNFKQIHFRSGVTWATFFRSCYTPLSPYRPKSPHFTEPISYRVGPHIFWDMQFGWVMSLLYCDIVVYSMPMCILLSVELVTFYFGCCC